MIQPVCYTYKNKEELIGNIRDGANEKMFPPGPVITATRGMAENLWNYRKHSGKTVYINKVLRTLIPQWYVPASKLEQIIHLGDLINSPELCVTDKERLALKHNRMEIWNTVRALVEIGVEPDMLPKDYQGMDLFCKLYQEIWDHNGLIQDMKRVFQQWKHKKTFFHLISDMSLVKDNQTYHFFNKMKAVYFQGFYDITPMQFRFIQAFCLLDIPVYFLNHYDEELPDAYEIWSDNFYFKNLDHKPLVAMGNSVQRHYCKVFSDVNVQDNTDNDVSIQEYPDVFSFARKISNRLKDDDLRLYTPGREDLQTFMDTFFPEQVVKKHFLAYPVGQYLYQLYQMWDTATNSLRFDADDIRTCLATGWAGRKTQDIDRYMSVFNKCAVYFTDCHTWDDWHYRIELLRDVQKNILSLFDTVPEDSSYKRWHRIMGNPLSMIGPFSISRKELDGLSELLDDILADARALFQESGRIDLKNHFRRVESLLKEKEAYTHMVKEEKEAAAEIFRRLKGSPQYITECSNDSLAEAMLFFLGGKLDDEDDDDEEDKDSKTKSYAALESAFYQDKKVMMCFCDDRHMPGAEKIFPWPLGKEILKHLHTSDKDIRILSETYIHYVISTRLSNRYLFYLALQLPNVVFSWIDTFNNQTMVISPYLKVLSMKNGYNISIEKINTLEKNIDAYEYQVGEDRYEDSGFCIGDEPPVHSVQEIEMNRRYCKWRNVYDYILQEQPVFTSSFQLKFLVTNFVKMISEKSNIPIETVMRQLDSILPIWNQTEQKEKIAFASRIKFADSNKENKGINLNGRSDLENKQYLNIRLYLKYLPNKTIEKLKEEESNSDALPKKTRCRYCPHNDICYFAEWGDDSEDING